MQSIKIINLKFDYLFIIGWIILSFDYDKQI